MKCSDYVRGGAWRNPPRTLQTFGRGVIEDHRPFYGSQGIGLRGLR